MKAGDAPQNHMNAGDNNGKQEKLAVREDILCTLNEYKTQRSIKLSQNLEYTSQASEICSTFGV